MTFFPLPLTTTRSSDYKKWWVFATCSTGTVRWHIMVLVCTSSIHPTVHKSGLTKLNIFFTNIFRTLLIFRSLFLFLF